ncbi:MAG: hypothetical protein ACRDFB_01610 [Rhabdochlamydiaceae bacterium]
MLCQIIQDGKACNTKAQIKHHITYFPEETIAVCIGHHDKIHSGKYPQLTQDYIKYIKGDATLFYQGKHRLEKFLKHMNHK